MKNFRLRLQAMCIAMLLGVITMSAQEIRYVKENGSGSKNGSSWDHAYANIQDAINDLVNNNKTGEVWVAAGHYYPTETTEASNSPYYKSFKIPAGITVRGGFKSDLTASSDKKNTTTERPLKSDKNFGKAGEKDGLLDGEGAKSGKYENETVLHGDLTGRNASFTWNPNKNQFDATFYGNSYHVVWFAMNGFSSTGRANALVKPAKLEGCVIEGGNALATTTTAPHPHIAYGGGIYMVANSFVYNCEVRNCAASRNGGGIYMDGGGIVRRTYVHHCQALGLGTEYGLGGGICENGGAGNSKANPVVVAQSVVTNCVGRMGGGMALLADATEGNNKYTVVANSTLVNNNTAQIEAGGVYTYKGGGLASMTIVRNKCYGTGVMQNEVVTGRSGGVYSRDAAYVANSVLWGNECSSNNDVQYATSQSSLNSTEKSKFYYNALSKADNTDWSGATKMGLESLADNNESTGGTTSKGFPLFFNPTATAGYLANIDANDLTPEDDTPEKKATKMEQWPNWQVSSESFLSYAGIATVDLDYEGLTPAPTGKNWDMQFGEFNSRPTIGALISQVSDIAPATDITYEGVKYDYAFFVDPDFIYAGDNKGDNGTDWGHPARFLGSILDFIAEPKTSHTFLTAPVFTDKKVAVFVKQGTVDNTRIGGNSRVRVTTLDIPSNVSLFGSFNSQLVGTDLSMENVVHTPTVISGKLMDQYDLNVARLLNIDKKHDIHIEGFKISYANASSTKLDNTNQNGAAITVVGSEDITFRNIVVSNCTANQGPAVYADKSAVRFENCIFHNNESKIQANSGIVYGVNGSVLDFDHCDVLRNVGHASYLGDATTNHWQNSIFYGNLDRTVGDTNIDSGNGDSSNPGLNKYALTAFEGNTAQATGSHCMFDARSASYNSQFGGNDTGNQWQYNLQYAFVDGTGQGYPRFINPTKNAGITEDGDQTYYGRATSFEPHNNNPIVNMASHADIHTSWGKDIVDVTRDFGGLPDIGAVENHEANQFEEGENAYTDGQKAYGDAYYVRDYASGSGTTMKTFDKDGTENAEGKGIYTASGELLDGASWEYAVNGNGDYTREATVEHAVNTVFKTDVTTTPGSFDGTFTISTTKSGTTYYLYLDGNTPKVTTTAANATKFEVGNVTGESVAAGSHYIRAKVGNNYRYLTRSGSSASTQTTSISATLSTATGGLRIYVNSRYYYLTNNNALGVSSTSSAAWTFTANKSADVSTGTETPLKQDGTVYSGAKEVTGVSKDAPLNDPLKFHVYKSLEDYNNAVKASNIEAVTYKIKRNATGDARYLQNPTGTYANYFYPSATGDNFILIQDGEYGKYYIYDVTTQKYINYVSTGSYHVQADANNKVTWWIDTNNGALNIVYGDQPFTTTENYAITCGTGTTTTTASNRVNLGAKSNANAPLVLVANATYDVYNYTESGKAQVTLNGLQYAVNLANEKFELDNKSREVKVGKGIYTNKTDADVNSVSQPYAYMMKDGVNVYGGFPANGNPGMNERQPKEFETILQPQSESPYVTMNFVYGSNSDSHPTVGSGHKTTDHIDMYEISNWGANAKGNNANDQASVGRVLVQPNDFTVVTSWDGFTLQHGYLNTTYRKNIYQTLTGTGGLVPDEVKVAGGAGALLQGNGVLTNCKIAENLVLCVPRGNTNMIAIGDGQDTNSLFTNHIGGAGVFMTGDHDSNHYTAVIENCEISNNQLLTKAVHSSGSNFDHIWQYGAGLYQNGGNVYNTIIHDNTSAVVMGTTISGMTAGTIASNEMVLGAGAFIAKGNFYNNTIVANTSATFFHAHTNHVSFAGVHVFDNARIYNSIIADNLSHWAYEDFANWGGTNPGEGIPVSAFEDGAITRESRAPGKVNVKYSFVDVRKRDFWEKTGYGPVAKDMVYLNDTGNTNIYLNYKQYEAYADADNEQEAKHPNIYSTADVYVKETGATQYHLKAASPCFNTGTEDIKDASGNDVTIPDYDAEYTDRIKDCTIDIGAYEFNGAAAVEPTVTGEQAVFYVTHNGFGTRTGKNATNAACAAKLQVVLDAAGRYKYLNPGKQVIVKVANDKAMQDANSDFTYYATRTTDLTDQDVRVWSIMVPRGVEVWGGYTDVPMMKDANDKVVKDTNGDHKWGEEYNGFYSGTTDLRDIIGNPTYFDSHYVNKLEKTEANTYHVVTFTDRIFDQNGLAYTKKDFDGKTAEQVRTILSSGAPSTYIELPGNNEDLFAHMSESFGGYTGISGNVIMDGENPKQIAGNYASNRAVIDGIFVSGGQADASSNSTSSTVNINSYGGAALVNEFAYVRNCILTGNTASNGGALALTDRALVTGCLIMENEAHYNGGGIYVFEDGTKLSDGRVISTAHQDGDLDVMDYRMSHVMTSTIVNNNAGEEGGGVWYTTDYNTNVRFNSVAIWDNTAKGQENVYGMVNPEQPTDDETISELFYPFSYSIIQNIRASGTNNLNVTKENREGMRFVQRQHDVDQDNNLIYMANENGSTDAEKDFGFYGLTTYSMLSSAGMPKTFYNQLKSSMAIADNDLMGKPRVDDDEDNIFVEVGARALGKRMPKKQLMLRLFVAHPEDVNTEIATSFMELADKASITPAEEYYSQEGSSFAYPFNSLQQALDYIKLARNGKIISGNTDSKNLPFEILVGKGEWYPKRSLNSETHNVWAATYAIPEGVTIMGGFNPQGGGATFYGRYNEPKSTLVTTKGSIYDNVTSIPKSNTVTPDPKKEEIGRGNNFGSETVNGKEFQQWHIQDIADRRAMSDINKNGIVEPWEFTNQTIISGNAVNGETDGVYHIMTAVADAHAVGNMPMVQSQVTGEFNEDGYHVKEEGQQIRLNGLVVTGGNALTYLSTALDDYGSYIFYQGAGLQVDGNRYSTSIDKNVKPVFHNSAAYGVGYRDIPVSITNCQFRNNKAGYGGAISTNGSLSIFGSSFEQNIAYAQTEKPAEGETWTSWVNDQNHQHGGTNVTEVMYPGQGGAILATYQLSAFNTLFANNEARYNDEYYPAVITPVEHPTFRRPTGGTESIRAAGGAIMMGSAANHHIVNCDFVRNKANAYPAVFTMNPTKQENDIFNTHKYSQIINTVAWGNEVNQISSDENYLRAAKLMVNIGKKNRTGAYDPTFNSTNIPSAADLANNNAESTTWQEATWFCAYEDGVGFKPNNTNDLREAISYTAGKFAPTMIKDANNSVYQNCNISISADNMAVDGPSFGNPSMVAGYDGFTESADWSPSRFNKLTDNGNGWIKQTVTEISKKGSTKNDSIKVEFNNNEALGTGYQGAYSYTHYISEIDGNEGAFPEYKLWLAIGNEKYMQATNDPEKRTLTINGETIVQPQKNMPRISPDPTKGVKKAYIDIGVYEYIKPAIVLPGSEVDILWVSTKENPSEGPATGLTWKTPMSDLQRAIETLLSSRNGHKKEIRLMEGEYAPVTPKTVGGKKYNAFVIDTKSVNEGSITPSTFTGTNNDSYYAQSITIKGGYSSTIPYEYDPVTYKTTIRQKEAVDGSSTDYLIYIADPTVRYAYKETSPGVSGYTSGNNYGAKVDGAGDEQARSVKTMPVQVDGVTLINDKAKEGTKGSAIYYPDYTGTGAPESNISGAHNVSAGGKVLYYETKADLEAGDKTKAVDHETEFAEITDEGASPVSDTKLLITKTEVIGSGKKGDTSANASAVYIGQKGGAALIYNSVFHSNYGMPLDAYNTINVNNTFGKNTGFVRLQNADGVTYVQSQMHNTALWKNNETSTKDVYGAQVLFGSETPTASADLFSYNSYTGGPATATVGNTALVNDNSNIGEGPNFVDPENADIFARNFDIKPSIRLLNQGDDESITSGLGKYYTLVVNNKYDFSLASTTDVDVLNRPRLKANRIDIGAYEFQGSLSSILYVDPNKSHNDDATGANWDEAFGYGDLQDAVDLASISHATNKAEESYVFVKGNSSTNTGKNTNETLTIRDGVTVYGSIGSDYIDWHDIKNADGTTPKYNNIEEYIADMKSKREGVASNAASKTIVTGIKTSDGEYDGTPTVGETEYNTPALVDGFVVTDPNSPKTPVLDVTNPSADAVIVVRNVVVADNDLSSATGTDVNVAQISNGLIYEALFRDNAPKGNGAVLKVANNPEGEYVNGTTTTRGFAVNVTVEGKTVGANNTMPVDGENESATQIFKSITNSINGGSGKNAAGAAAPYGQITNKGISGYFYNIADPNLNYQLTETSSYIDACTLDQVTTEGEYKGHPNFLPNNLKKFINYDTDRDLLGNPRYLANLTIGNKIDRGAFETWRVDNNFVCGKWTQGGNTYGTNQDREIGAQFYPHDGSVVYVMAGKSLVIDPLHEGEQIKPTPENPGFLLVKEGGNFYGNGRPVTAAYVAIERTVPATGAIVSVPYGMKYKTSTGDISVVGAGSGDLQLTAHTAQQLRRYNGNSRSDWKYIFQDKNHESPCWDPIAANAVTPASEGVFFLPEDGTSGTLTYRFTGKGTSLTDYIYTETTADSKTIVLTKNDDAESTAGGADYTDDLDMSWNCFGLPYLVSNYKPYEKATEYGKAEEYMMNIPHTLWLYYNGTVGPDNQPVDGDGGYYSVKAWKNADADWHVSGSDAEAQKAIWVGEGIFTQTATLDDTESLVFYRPVAPATFAAKSFKSMARYYVDTTGVDSAEKADDVELISTEYYTTDGVRMSKVRKGGVTVIRKIYSDGSVKTSKQFVK